MEAGAGAGELRKLEVGEIDLTGVGAGVGLHGDANAVSRGVQTTFGEGWYVVVVRAGYRFGCVVGEG